MPLENIVTVVGNLADDPELRYTERGVAVASVRVAVNQRFFDKQAGSWDERLDGYFTCNVWRDAAENVKNSLRKGDRVLVTGRLRSRSYEPKEGGPTRWVTEIEADEVCPTLRFAVATPQRVSRVAPDEVASSDAPSEEDADAPVLEEATPF